MGRPEDVGTSWLGVLPSILARSWAGGGPMGVSLLPDPTIPGAFPLQIILALGNYMNSSKRGAVYGFKLQSLDLVGNPRLPGTAWAPQGPMPQP